MAERLFRGQIQPAARPLGSFLQPSQNNIPGAAQLASMPRGSQIATLQQAGTSSVAGFNQMEQLSNALKPFSAQLQKSVDRGMRQYAINNIESGYYDTLKNEEVKARLIAQQNKEASTADAADTIGKIEAVDPIAGQLAREANPWRAVGRNRALAQLAASQVGPLLAAELQQPQYAGIKPGSSQLAEAKATVTQGLLSRFGLTGEELESTYYVTPAINKGWDKFSQEQAKIYNATLAESQTVLASTAVSTFMDGIRQNGGLLMSDGTVLTPRDPLFAEVAGKQLTGKIDASLNLLGGKSKNEAWEQIQKTLGFWAGSGTEGALQVVQQVGVGPSKDANGMPIEYENRARYFQAYPLELVDNTNTALKARNEQSAAIQTTVENQARADFFSPEGPMGVPYGSNEYQERYAAWVSKWSGSLRTVNELGTKLSDEYQETTGVVSAPTVGEVSGIIGALNNLTPGQIDTPEKVEAIVQQIDTFARNTAGGDSDLYLRSREQLMKILEQKQQNFGTVAQNIGLQGNLTRFVNEDLADSGIADLLSTEQGFVPGQSWQDRIRNAGNLSSNQKQVYLNFGNEVRSMYQREYDRLATKWWGENPNASVMPQGKGAELLDEAKNNVRKDIRYGQLRDRARNAGKPDPGKTIKPSTPPNSSQPTNTPPVQFTPSSSGSATAQQAGKYATAQVMSKQWIGEELDSILKKGYASPAMNDFANKAGTSSAVLIRRQLDLFSSTDPAKQKALDEYKAKLDEYINRQSSSELPGQANYEYAMAPSAATYNPRAPGAWLMETLITRLPGGESGPSQGPYTPVKNDGSGYMPDGREPGVPAPLPMRA